MTLDEIYGCSLGEYLDYLGKSKEQLIAEIEKEIELLRKNYMHYANHKDDYTLQELLAKRPIADLIEKKIAHLKRVKAWK